MILLKEDGVADVMLHVAQNVKARRLEMNLTQEGLASRAGVKLPTYRKFERTGRISFEALLQVAFALGALDEVRNLFGGSRYESIADVLGEGKNAMRKRGTKK